MEREEPSACLVHALSDEVGGEACPVVNLFGVFEGIVELSIGHRAGVEPDVDKVGFAM